MYLYTIIYNDICIGYKVLMSSNLPPDSFQKVDFVQVWFMTSIYTWVGGSYCDCDTHDFIHTSSFIGWSGSCEMRLVSGRHALRQNQTWHPMRAAHVRWSDDTQTMRQTKTKKQQTLEKQKTSLLVYLFLTLTFLEFAIVCIVGTM